MRRPRVPVFGINFGTIGFLAAAERDELEAGARPRASAAASRSMPLPGLHSSIEDVAQLALNDISFTRRPHGRVAELSYSLGGQEVGHVRCDGLVAATPAGSTGYNLANNGPILAWGVEGYVVSFIAPHTLTARALVVAPDDVLHVAQRARQGRGGHRPRRRGRGRAGGREEIEVRFRDDVGPLAQLPGSTSTGGFARSSAASPTRRMLATGLARGIGGAWSASGGP